MLIYPKSIQNNLAWNELIIIWQEILPDGFPPGGNGQSLVFGRRLSANINQNLLAGDQVLQVFCVPPQGVRRSAVSYLLLNAEAYFAINPMTGAVSLQVNALELPAESTYSATVQCTVDYDRVRLRNATQIEVVYAEENQYVPVFTVPSGTEVVIPETRDISLDAHVITLNAVDQDLGRYGNIAYEIHGGNEANLFEVGSTTGVVTLVATLDYETDTSHELIIRAVNLRERQGAAKFSEVEVRVIVDPRNDEPPVFEQKVYTLSLEENTRPLNFLQILCSDADTTPDYIVYVSQSQGMPFSISYGAGELSATSQLDYEHASSYSLSFDCVDIDHSTPENYLRDRATVNISVLPVNEYRPELKGSSVVFADIPETLPAGTLIASGLPNTGARITFQFSDDDEGLDHGTIHYYLERGGEDFRLISEHLHLDELSGNLSLVRPFELNLCNGVNDPYILRLTIMACDIPDRSVCPTLRVYIKIIPVDCVPEFEHEVFQLGISEGVGINSHLETIPCRIPQLEDEMTTIGIASLEPETLRTFTIDQQGFLTLQKALDFEQKQNFTFNIHCVDSRDNEAVTVVTVNVLPENDNKPVFEQALLVVNVTEPIVSTPVTVGYIQARDNDTGYGSTLTYKMESNAYFKLESDGALVLKHLPNSALENAFVFKAEASDGENTASVTVLVLLPKDEEACRSATSAEEQSDNDTTTIGLYGAIGVLSAILLVCVVVSICLLCVIARRSAVGRMQVTQNGNLRVIPMNHDRDHKT